MELLHLTAFGASLRNYVFDDQPFSFLIYPVFLNVPKLYTTNLAFEQICGYEGNLTAACLFHFGLLTHTHTLVTVPDYFSYISPFTVRAHKSA